MVSLRRRKLLGFSTGVQQNPGSVHPVLLDDLNFPAEDCSWQHSDQVSGPSEEEICPVKVTDSSPSKDKDEHNQPSVCGSTSSKDMDSPPIKELEVKRRKQHRRRGVNSEENSVMRGVYYKNMKWQAAIKVDKKQIHLGTVSSQQEAAHLYDRAAFMCGREPNFELEEEVKQQLKKLKWDEFLSMTRSAITNKRTRRGHSTRKVAPSLHNSDGEGEQGTEGS
ncbi:hypothetical protein SOVF_020130 [Spinacia oleracea]|uniref:Ethylene-responsive transcription factor-like protein At4g13040 isoform X2 n=1 Tax=Spinacia oleracea TaxID=3562 RepID=A0A9R0KBD1_SPIOL|nr:ethylene-responsive transcription factor-like protein At4g13040 isoform X2 [Spinacia oleracea]XP_056684357.1 ethylene-responsive transcription factor-like protein At4g13040 isoform X2 [Spinacia oleracea]XP_056684359.1 ethylene-responsive transcription factor-like protein At4g13040 isoform X2 [Spinacia oleracea]KNA23995.1 hypothetical protein SOVF_020130 [Spinacia oleracea]